MTQEIMKKPRPELRFKGFTDDWAQRKFGDLYQKVTEKYDAKHDMNAISVANMQFRSVESTDCDYLKTYNVMRVGDIAFEGNKSRYFSHGRFVENTIGNGIISHVFDVFRPVKQQDLSFWRYLIHNEQVMGPVLARCTSSSIMMNNLIGQDFLKLSIYVPSDDEQKLIGEFFRTLDNLIVAAERKVELLKRRKKAYLQRIFNQELRCKGFSESWHWQKASDIFEPVTIKGLLGLPVLSVTQEHGVVHREKLDIDIKYDESSLTTYKKVSPGDFIISLRSFQGGFELSQVEGIVSPAYTVLEFRNPSDSDPSFWRHFFKSYDFIQLLKKVTFGIRDGKSISYEQFASLKLPIPAYAEQIRIGACLNAMDDLISAAEHRIELLQKRKQGYMQRMFA